MHHARPLTRTGAKIARLAGMVRHVYRLGVLTVLGLVTGAGALSAQHAHPPGSTPELGVLVSHSARSETPVAQAVTLTTVEVEWILPVSTTGRWGLEYAAAATMAAVQENPQGVLEARPQAWVVWNPPPPATTFGVGLRGLGMRGWWGGERLRLQADLAGGFLYFDTPLLAANAARFNFTGAASVGLRVAVGEEGHLALGYRIHHLSNGGLGEVNPGVDAHQVYVGAWVR